MIDLYVAALMAAGLILLASHLDVFAHELETTLTAACVVGGLLFALKAFAPFGQLSEEDITQLHDATEAQTREASSKGKWHNDIIIGNKRAVLKKPELLTQRGPVGELPLHFAFLQKQFELGFDILKKKPELITWVYHLGDKPGERPSPYEGENILHIAIVREMPLPDIRKLVLLPGGKELLQQRVTGTFFRDPYFKVKDGRDKLEGQCYLGEYPLAFAITSNQFDTFDCLCALGADMSQLDSSGNNLLHVLVIKQNIEGYAHFKKKWIEKHYGCGKVARDLQCDDEGVTNDAKQLALPWLQRNNDGMTPFTLAAFRGLRLIFEFLLEEDRQTQWMYSQVKCSVYPLDDGLDNLAAPPSLLGGFSKTAARGHHKSALELIILKGHYQFFAHPRIRDLYARKWAHFASKKFTTRVVLDLLRLLFLAWVVYNFKDTQECQCKHKGSKGAPSTSSGSGSGSSSSDSNRSNFEWSSSASSSLREKSFCGPGSTIECSSRNISYRFNGVSGVDVAWLLHYLPTVVVLLGGLYDVTSLLRKAACMLSDLRALSGHSRGIVSVLLEYTNKSFVALPKAASRFVYFAGIAHFAYLQLVSSSHERKQVEVYVLCATCLSAWFSFFLTSLAWDWTGPLMIMVFLLAVRFLAYSIVITGIFGVLVLGIVEAFFVLDVYTSTRGGVRSMLESVLTNLFEFMTSLKFSVTDALSFPGAGGFGEFSPNPTLAHAQASRECSTGGPYWSGGGGGGSGGVNFNFRSSNYGIYARILLSVLLFLIQAMCFNLLTAFMNDTYKEVKRDAELRWQLERARIISSIERDMSQEERDRAGNKFYLEIGDELGTGSGKSKRFLQVYDKQDFSHNQNDEDEQYGRLEPERDLGYMQQQQQQQRQQQQQQQQRLGAEHPQQYHWALPRSTT